MAAVAELYGYENLDTLPVRVAVYDPQPVVLAGLAASFEACTDLCLEVGRSDLEALSIFGESVVGGFEADVVVADLTQKMGSAAGRSGALDFVRRMTAGGIGVVVFGDASGPGVIAALLAAGASAVVSKRAPLSSLADVVRAVASGEPVGPVLLPGVCDVVQPQEPAAHGTLTERESEVFVMLAECLTPKEIAFELRLALSTVYTHVDRVRRKLGVSTLPEVVSYAARWGILAD